MPRRKTTLPIPKSDLFSVWDTYLNRHQKITYKDALYLAFGEEITSRDPRYTTIALYYYEYVSTRKLRRRKVGFRVTYFVPKEEAKSPEITLTKSEIYDKWSRLVETKGLITYRSALEVLVGSGVKSKSVCYSKIACLYYAFVKSRGLRRKKVGFKLVYYDPERVDPDSIGKTSESESLPEPQLPTDTNIRDIEEVIPPEVNIAPYKFDSKIELPPPPIPYIRIRDLFIEGLSSGKILGVGLDDKKDEIFEYIVSNKDLLLQKVQAPYENIEIKKTRLGLIVMPK
jgi:hypothetical protein